MPTRKLTSERLLDAAFEAAFGGSQAEARMRAALRDAVADAVALMPRNLPGALRRSGPVVLTQDGCGVKCEVAERGVVAVHLSLEGGVMCLSISAWRKKSIGVIDSCVMPDHLTALSAPDALRRSWRRIDATARVMALSQ